MSNSNGSSSSHSHSNKTRQLSHLNAQLALLQAHLSDTENLLSVTKVQAECLRWMAGYSASLFMASSKVLGEESLKAAGLGGAGGGAGTSHEAAGVSASNQSDAAASGGATTTTIGAAAGAGDGHPRSTSYHAEGPRGGRRFDDSASEDE
ncbi:MAG: hypothetical protein M1815_004744 [Lichina confinis]|nr:MAG: hypothetical protein M1815_004744 [Lichina confinis]